MSPSGPASTPPPEEKLLRLIRGGQGAAAASSAPTAAAAPRRAMPRTWAVPSTWIMGFNAVLGVVLVMEAAGWWWLMNRGEPTAPPPAMPQTITPIAPPATEAAESLPSLASAAAAPLFGIEQTSTPASIVKPPAVVGPSEDLKKLSGRLSLLGVVAGPPGEAIIEDAQTQKTYSVTVGQQVVDGIVLEEVRENRAILSLNGEKIELSL